MSDLWCYVSVPRSGIRPRRRASAWSSGGSILASRMSPSTSMSHARRLRARRSWRQNSGSNWPVFSVSRMKRALLVRVLFGIQLASLNCSRSGAASASGRSRSWPAAGVHDGCRPDAQVASQQGRWPLARQLGRHLAAEAGVFLVEIGGEGNTGAELVTAWMCRPLPARSVPRGRTGGLQEIPDHRSDLAGMGQGGRGGPRLAPRAAGHSGSSGPSAVH